MSAAVLIRRESLSPVSDEPDEQEPITGRFPRLAEIVRELMGGMSSRVAARKTGVNHNTIANMRHGDRASIKLTIQFARGFKVDPNILLEASEYPRIEGGPIGGSDEEIERISDPDTAELVRYYHGAPPDIRRAVKQTLRTAADMAREIERGRTIGALPQENEQEAEETQGSAPVEDEREQQ